MIFEKKVEIKLESYYPIKVSDDELKALYLLLRTGRHQQIGSEFEKEKRILSELLEKISQTFPWVVGFFEEKDR